MKRATIAAFFAIALILAGCWDEDNPAAPETRLRASFSVAVSPPAIGATDCRLSFEAKPSGGKPPYGLDWDLNALSGKYTQRDGGDADAKVQLITSSVLVGSGAYRISLDVSDSADGFESASGFVLFNCVPGAQPASQVF